MRRKITNIKSAEIKDPVIVSDSITLNQYLSKHSRARNLDKVIIKYCQKLGFYHKTKTEWDNIVIDFFK